MYHTLTPINNTHKEFINQISIFFPERRKGKRGPDPIPKEVLLNEIFMLINKGLGWRDIRHPTVCRNYLEEVQRRGIIKNMFHFLSKEFTKFRVKESIIDTTELESYDFINEVSYSGKSHNNSTKLLLEITPEYIPIGFIFSKGSYPDSKLLDKYLSQKEKLPYKLNMDKGFENYARRRSLKRLGCQVYIEQKNIKNNRKRGPRFSYSKENKRERTKVERFFAWIQHFKKIRFRQERKVAIFHAFVMIGIIYYLWRKKL
jgi:hypothetical protein